jgi:hypothetical protein
MPVIPVCKAVDEKILVGKREGWPPSPPKKWKLNFKKRFSFQCVTMEGWTPILYWVSDHFLFVAEYRRTCHIFVEQSSTIECTHHPPTHTKAETIFSSKILLTHASTAFLSIVQLWQFLRENKFIIRFAQPLSSCYFHCSTGLIAEDNFQEIFVCSYVRWLSVSGRVTRWVCEKIAQPNFLSKELRTFTVEKTSRK